MRVQIQGRVPYQDSLRWQIQYQYYKHQDIAVFLKQEVPYDITSNPRFARQCAQVVQAALRESSSPRPLRILEVGAGLGVFAFHFLSALSQAWEPIAPGRDWEYWMTDLSPATVRSWSQQPALAPWLASGQLHIACLDSLAPDKLTTADGEALIPPPGWDVVIANYHLCVLPVAILLCREGAFYQVESELFYWLAGSPQAPPPVKKRQQILAQLAAELQAWNASGITDTHLAQAVQQVIPEIAQTMVLPAVAQNWQPTMELRSSLIRWLLEALPEAYAGVHSAQLARILSEALDLPSFRVQALKQEQLQDVYTPCPVQLEQLIVDPLLCQVLAELSQELNQAVLMVSQVGFSLLTHLCARLNPGGIMLLSDKGLYALEQLQGLAWPMPSYHGGSLAQMVNFPLLVRWFQRQGHATCWTQDLTALIQTLLVGMGSELSERLQACFEQTFIRHNRNMEHILWLQAGSAFYQQRKFEDALRYYHAALRIAPEDETTLLFMASTYLDLKRPEQARACLARIPDMAWPHPAHLKLQAALWQKLGHLDRASAVLEHLKHSH